MPQQENTIHQANRQIARAAGTVMIAYILSNLAGLLAKMLTATLLVRGWKSEAFYAANRFSEILFNLVAGGHWDRLYPTFTGFLVKKDHEGHGGWPAPSLIGFADSHDFLHSKHAFARQVVHYILAPGFSL
jgi:putative peptidoglycan lipid II flippase